MISIVIPARNGRQLVINCLNSLIPARGSIPPAEVEFILIDDCSDPEHGITDLFLEFRRQVRSPVKIARFRQRRFYGWGCAFGFALAQGSEVLFLSYDMCLTPHYLKVVREVAALDQQIGLVRGTAEVVHMFPQHVVVPPLPLRSFHDVQNFSAYILAYHGLRYTEDPFLTGDAMLIKRAVFDKIGSFDTRFPYGYLSDIDFGLRCLRAGFKMVCAKGAWLHHEGAGSYREESLAAKIPQPVLHARRMEYVQACYNAFRDKWDKSLPQAYTSVSDLAFPHLRDAKSLPFDEFQPFVPLSDPLVEML